MSEADGAARRAVEEQLVALPVVAGARAAEAEAADEDGEEQREEHHDGQSRAA